MDALTPLRTAKHQMLLVSKRARRFKDRTAVVVNDRYRTRLEEKRPFTYVEGMFPHTFLNRPTPSVPPQRAVPATLWAFWLGGAPNDRRAASLRAIEKISGVDVNIVTAPEQILIPEHPFHPAVEDLHVVHRSDYLRAYALHHHGGAYLDIKPQAAPVRTLIDRVNSDDDAWILGYRESTSANIPELPHYLGGYLRAHFRAALGTSAFICRPHSVFTAEWMRELHARLDYLKEPLREADASRCNPYAAPIEYPIRWTEILGDITQPLCLKHQAHVRFSDELRPRLKEYR